MIITIIGPFVKCEYPAKGESPKIVTTLAGSTEIKQAIKGSMRDCDRNPVEISSSNEKRVRSR